MEPSTSTVVSLSVRSSKSTTNPAFSFGCGTQFLSLLDQAVYNRPKVVDRVKHKEGKDVLEVYQLAQRLQSMVHTINS